MYTFWQLQTRGYRFGWQSPHQPFSSILFVGPSPSFPVSSARMPTTFFGSFGRTFRFEHEPPSQAT